MFESGGLVLQLLAIPTLIAIGTKSPLKTLKHDKQDFQKWLKNCMFSPRPTFWTNIKSDKMKLACSVSNTEPRAAN